MSTPENFIVIDDDPINNMVCKQVIEQSAGPVDIKTFVEPEKGFEYISKEYPGKRPDGDKPSTVLFLDINMPTWSGWEFLEKFDQLDEKIKKQIKIYMLSSSVDENDIERARSNADIADYVTKPLAEETVAKIMTGYSKN